MQMNAIVFKVVGVAIAVFFLFSGLQLALAPERTYRKWYGRALVWPERVQAVERKRVGWLAIRIVGLVFVVAGLAFGSVCIYAIVIQTPLATPPEAIRSKRPADSLAMLLMALIFLLGGMGAFIWPDALTRAILGKTLSSVQREESGWERRRFRILGVAMIVGGALLFGVYLLRTFA